MTTYRVTWDIDIEADSPDAAAREALRIQRNPESIATVFYVARKGEAPTGTLVDAWRAYQLGKLGQADLLDLLNLGVRVDLEEVPDGTS